MQRKDVCEPERLNVSAVLPKDAALCLLRDLLCDLDVCALDYGLHSALRAGEIPEILKRLSRYDARSIVDRLDAIPANVSTFAKLYQVGALIKKYPFKGLDTFTPAFEKFSLLEQRCKLYNEQNYRSLIKLNKAHPRFFGVLNDLRKEVYDLIGAAPEIDLVYASGLHGPGQTAGGQFRNGEVTEYFKFTTLPYTVSTLASPHAKAAIESDPRWIGGLMDWYRESKRIPQWSPISMDDFWLSVFQTVDCSTITSVPKTALTDRFIAMEPTMNVFLQLGVDRVLREKLRASWGYDLNDQSKNQKLAEVGSITGSFATLDLVGASDCIALMLVYLLFPPEWVALLLDLRMSSGYIKKLDRFIHFSKLSSMGNGYTFVIESIIFGAATRVAMKRTKSYGESAVYGDDIVCPTGAVTLLVEILDLLGFEVNSSKSFTSGPFRESCGADFFLGHNVRPLFITEHFADVPQLFHLANSLAMLEQRWEWPHGHTYQRTRRRILSWIPPDFRGKCRGPFSETTNTHLFCDEPLLRDRKGYRYFLTLVERPLKFVPKRRDGYMKFHLRKLMVQPKAVEQSWWDFLFVPKRPIEKWDWRKKLTGGNAFDITRRDHTYFKVVRSYLPEKVVTPHRT